MGSQTAYQIEAHIRRRKLLPKFTADLYNADLDDDPVLTSSARPCFICPVDPEACWFSMRSMLRIPGECICSRCFDIYITYWSFIYFIPDRYGRRTLDRRASETVVIPGPSRWKRATNWLTSRSVFKRAPVFRMRSTQRNQRGSRLADLEPGTGPRVDLPTSSHGGSSPDPYQVESSSNVATSQMHAVPRSLFPWTLIGRMRPCYTLIILGIVTIVCSLVPALWRSAQRDDVSGGFSLAQYILGVGVFVIGSATVIHSKTCTCWQ